VIRRQLNLFRPLAGKGYFANAGDGKNPCCGVAPGQGHTSTSYEVSDLLAGFVDGYAHWTTFGMVGTRTWENGFFAQDDYRVNPHLTLNLGLRYDVLTWPVEVLNREANFDLTTGALIVAGATALRARCSPMTTTTWGRAWVLRISSQTMGKPSCVAVTACFTFWIAAASATSSRRIRLSAAPTV